MNYHKPYRRILAMALSIVVMLGILPVSATAEERPVGASGEIISFEALPEKTANQTVPLGTSFEELDLPVTLTVEVHIAAASDAEAPEQDSGEPGGQEPEQTKQSIPVTWVSDPDYDGNAAGVYTFTPSLDLPERLTLADGVSAPIITVAVGEAHDSDQAATTAAGEITAFASLSDDILWQSVEYGTASEDLNLPKTLSGTVEGRQAEVPVTWEAEPEYNGHAKGLYLLTAVPGEGFTASTELPVIAVVVRGETPRFMAFSRGGGALDTDPFLISSAAQLAAIAGIVNEGRLEALFLGLGVSGQVYLKLENDIDLSGYTSSGGWMPIGNNTNQFKGSFDGNSHTITGLTINRSSADHQGLFGYLLNGTVKNLGMANVSITGRGYVGGIVGLMNQAAVRNCYTTGSIKGMAHVGGVAGYVYGSGSALQSCYSTADITGTDTRVGGIAGFVDQSTMKDCAALNPFVSGKDSNTGRVAGQIATSLNVSGNIAFIGMTVTVNGVTQTISGDAGNGKNGADKYTDTIRLSDGTLDGLFTAAGGWTTEYGKLPGFGAAVDMPIHLLGSSPFEGSGSNGDPYQISTAAQLARLAELVNAGTAPYAEAGKFYLLMNDLNISGYASGEGWVPIGKNTSPYTAFKGSFNGNGKTITGLTINRPGTDYQGLFGYLDAPAAELKNLGMARASISGRSYVGGVAGYINSGTVQNCFVTGSVSGGNSIGGIVGATIFGMVQNCYMDGSVTGWGASVGGVAGSTASTVQNCYVTGSVIGDSEVGGVTGNLSAMGPGVVKNSAALCSLVRARATGFGRVTGNNPGLNITGNVAFDGMTALLNGAPKVISSLSNGPDGESKTVDEISTAGFFQTLFGSDSVWTYEDGKLPGLNGQAIPMPLHLLPAGQNPFGGGSGSDDNPYQIRTAAQLARLAQLVNAGNTTYNANGVCYKLMNGLDLSGYTSGEGWVPIGDNTNPFKGSFNGNHETITGLTINRTGVMLQGLFGVTDTGSLVQNFGVENVNVSGGDYTGGVVGLVSGTVQNCYSTGSVSGGDYTGGVAGNVGGGGKVQNCYTASSVSGAYNIGGVVGLVAGTVENSYSTGSVSGVSSVGGVAGYAPGRVENCAALNPLVAATGSASVGRVAGDVSGDNRLQNNYAYSGMTVTGQSGPKSIADSATGTDGKSRDKAALQAAGGFPYTSGAGDIFGAAPWTYTAGRLPGFGAAVDMPLHLISFSTTPLTVALSGTGGSGSGTSYSAPFSSSDRTVTLTVTGWEGWTNKEVTVTVKKPNNDAIAVTPQDTANGSASFVLPGSLNGNFTITAAAKSNPNNVKTTLTLTVTAPIITASAGAGGSISPSGPMTVPAGGSQTFAIAPDGGHIIASVTVDGVNRGAISTYTFSNVTGDHTISAAFTTEQFGLSPGGTYYFDLSGQGIPDTINAGLPDISLKWVPFTYAGTVNAYSLDASSSGDVSASGNAALSDRSLFVADYNVAHTVSWDDLNAVDLIFGKNYMMGGIEYKLRSLSAGSTTNGQSGANERGMPGPNEWDQLLNKDGGFIKNWNDKLTWGQDTSMGHFSARAVRGYFSARIWYDSTSSDRFADIGFRPILEVLNPGMLGTNGLKTVTYNMGGNGKLGGGSLTSATVVYTGALTLPEITSANGFTYTGSGTGTLGWYDGGTFYAPGATPSLAMGVTLTAGYGLSSTPLAAPTGLSWDGTTPGKATWGAVANASSYSVQLYKGGAVQSSPVSGITATEYNFASVIASAGTGSYTFRVTAIGDGTNYTDSAESAASVAYSYTVPPSSTPLATPTGLSWDSTTPGKATWSAVSNASSYSVQLYKGGAVQGSPVNSGTTTEYNFASIIAAAGNGSYTFRVTAIGDGINYTDSVESAASVAYSYTAPPSSTTLATPTGLSWDSTTPGKATWSAVSNASGYSVQLYKGGAVQGSPVNSGATTEYNFASIIAAAGNGSYTFKVTAIGDGTNYTDSAESAASAAYSYTGGNTGGASSGGSGSDSRGATITIQPVKKPDQPVIAGFSITPTVDTKGHATTSISQKDVEDAIKKALADAKAQGKTENGIGISVNLGLPDTAKSLGIVLPRTTLKSLIDAGVKQFEIGGVILSLDFDKKALDEIYSHSAGDITITIKPAQNLSEAAKKLIGTRPVYDVTISYVKAGKTVNITSLGSGSITLGIPYTPGKNEAVGYLFGVYADSNGQATRIPGSTYDANSGGIILDSNHFSIYGVGYTAPGAKFTDISTHWAKESIDYVVGRGLLSGTSEITFAPDTSMTRGMLVTALGRLAGADTKLYTASSFTDVKAGSTFQPYIEWAYKKGVIQGTGNGKFEPDRAVTREEIAVIFANFAKAAGYTLPVTREAAAYADADRIGSTYKTAVTAMQQAGIMMGGSGNKFNPKAGATRAEVSSMLHRYIKLTIDPATAQGWAKNDAGQYLYYRDGKALTGWQTIDGKKYFFNTDGSMQTGWKKDDKGNWYYFWADGALVGWWDIGANGNNKRYYFDTNAVMVSGKWLEIDGKWYYFNADGSLAVSTKIDGYEVDENGVRETK